MAKVTRFIVSHARSESLHQGHFKNWHYEIFKSVVPLSYYAGNFRCEDHSRPCLAQQVWIGGFQGLDYKLVLSEMKIYSAELHNWIRKTDEYLALGPTHPNVVRSILQLAAWAVGRLIQIHPFLNGNGRISRLVANYFFIRYGLPLASFDLFPRPRGDYQIAMAECMAGNFGGLYQYFLVLFANQAAR